jgi:hypothetical protein
MLIRSSLSVTAEWRLDGTGSFHEMRTCQFPLLAMWVWIGDIRLSTYSISP